ncbi:hypothetical protein like AT1G19260 [Hibiscus trionum]|uniref:HAT C-terminal dimerisation domain-containing protein n=1 Tax=Hibiscus trionum TaxID=183268 RepID=A0A9W7J8T9_HIBTR|nr:hypothetical protein like AT1G19260 [Hibiscus trionum]
MGKDINSAHGYSVQCWKDFKNPKSHIDALLENLTPKQNVDNRLRLGASIEVVRSSSKRHDELQDSQIAELEHLIEIEEIETGTGLNQIGTLQRPGDTRWSSHYKSICSVLRMYNATRSVLEKIAIDRRATYSQHALCRALQYKSQDILNAIDLVAATKSSIQEFRDSGWKGLLQKVLLFCNKHATLTLVPDMNATYSDIIRSRCNKDIVSVEHHYRVDVFTATMDQQLHELNSRFSEQTTELLIFSMALNPSCGYKHFNVEKNCHLAEKYYPKVFSEHEKYHLKYELELFFRDVPNHVEMKNLITITQLCRSLSESGKSFSYPLVDRLIRLILTLPVSTATTERAFSAMKIVKTGLRNKMEDDFLSDYLIVYIEKEIAEKFTNNSIIDDFDFMKKRRVQLNQ